MSKILFAEYKASVLHSELSQNIAVSSFFLWSKIIILSLKWLVTKEVTWYKMSLSSTHF